MLEISKKFSFEYAHRVWTQRPSKISSECKCQHIHGHSGNVEIFFRSKNNEVSRNTQMIIDFKELEGLKKQIEHVFDHKFILDIKDELFKTFDKFSYSMGKRGDGRKLYGKFDITPDADKFSVEIYKGITLVEFSPTSENLAELVYWLADSYLADIECASIEVSKVIFKETEKTSATFGK